MQVCIVNQINFKENHYHVIKTGRKYSLQEIRTDNAENLGKEPEIQCNQGSFPMIYDGKYYVGESDFTYYNTDKYRIFYNDTQSYENNGKEVNIDHKLLLSKCTIAHRHNNNLPMEFVHSKGEMKGFIITDLNNIPKKGNVILLVDEIKHVEARDLPNNVKGIITRGYNPGEYTHFSQYLNHHFAVVSSIYDDEKFEEIKKLEGKKVYINNTSGVLEYNENHKDVLMPQRKRVLVNEPNRGSFVYSRLLDFDVLTPTMSGNKGYRLGIMKKLSEQGVLKDITIPPGFVVPQYYLKDILNYLNEHTAKNNIDVFYDNPYLTELIEHCEKLGINPNSCIIRSNYNIEDLSQFSSAGMFYSALNCDKTKLVANLHDIEEAPYSFLAGKIFSGIKLSSSTVIRPSYIIQDFIDADYIFTMYTENTDGNIKIEMYDTKTRKHYPEPAVLIYDRKSEQLELKQAQNTFADFWLDKDGNILEQHQKEDQIVKDWNILAPLFSVLTAGGLVLEKHFNAPQDIEGGIKNGKVYFWQTRDIIKKAVRTL